MIGVFDSGAGGLTVIEEIRKTHPNIDICFFADRENAPYGTKSKEELISLVKRDIDILKSAGTDKILIGCCTACTVYGSLSRDERRISLPIIEPTAMAALNATQSGRVGVIATEATVRSGAFGKALHRAARGISVCELATQLLVTLVEGGASDTHISDKEKRIIYKALSPLREARIDTLILGCTHFARLERTVCELMPGVRVLSSSRCGAQLISDECDRGRGRTVYL